MSILVLGIIFCVFLMRIADRNSDRTRMALGWLVLAICGNVVFAAYEPLEFKTKLGLFNATFSWVCISFSFVECLLSRNKFTISRQAIQFQFFQVLYSALFILSAITNGGGFFYSHLFISATALILIYLAPISRDLVSIEWIGVACTTFIWFTLLSGYNPPEIDQRTGLPIAGTDAQSYRNVTWEIFNLDNRFHGPFTHPNQLGIFCAFFATILLTSNKRLFNFFGILNILLLFCAVSRTSIFSCLIISDCP